MLKAIKLDRKQHTFITNALKCRLPESRAPLSSEVELCLPVLKRQIEIIRPKALLLLGLSGAHALLERTGTIEQLRNQEHTYAGVSVVVTYHPAELLRHTEYKRPAWEDLQRLQRILEERGVYGLQ
jgi:DNA polymerase